MKRTVSSIIFAVIAFLCIYLVHLGVTIVFDVVVVLLGLFGSFELIKAYGNKMNNLNKLALILYCLAILPTYYIFQTMSSITALFIFYFWTVGAISLSKDINARDNFPIAIFIGMYPVLMFSFLIPIAHLPINGTIALALIFIVGPFSDVGAYIVGSTVKGKKLAPHISPNKTISGAIGGLFGGVIGGLSCYLINEIFHFSPVLTNIWFYVGYGFVGAILTEFGDLIESKLKRGLNIKDSGKLLPGHGGIMDRFDGVLMVVAATYMLLYFMG